jgi:hypothetical protein
MPAEERDTEKSLKDISVKIVKRLRARRLEIVQAIHTRIQESVPDSVASHNSTYQAGVLAAITAVLDYCLEAIEHGLEWSGPVPPEAAAQARRAAHAGVSLGTVLRRYFAGHRRLGEFVAEEVEHLGLSYGPAQYLRRTQEAVLERLTAAIEHEYPEERERIARPPEHRRTEIVRRLLAKEPVEFAELAELDYELDTSWHLGVIATGTGVHAALLRLKADLRSELLPAQCADGTVWAWFGASQRLKIADIERMLTPNGTTGEILAIGGSGWGLDGWRRTHREARGAQLRALRRPERVVRYAESPLLVAALENETLATWLREFLAPIRARPDSKDLLKTLRAYIDAECSRSSAAPVAKVRRQTVGNRLHLAAKLLDRPLSTCLAELDVALQLADLTSEDSSFNR